MPFPTSEEVREAVERAVREGLEAQSKERGSWLAVLANGQEKELSFEEDGTVSVEHCLPDTEWDTVASDEPVEKVYKLRVRVDFVG